MSRRLDTGPADEPVPRDPFLAHSARNAGLLVALVAMLVMPAPVAIGLSAMLGAVALRRLSGSARPGRAARAPASSNAASQSGTVVTLGVGSDGKPIVLTDEELAAHGLILGASGSGKTTTMLKILEAQIERGRPVVAIDMKGSPAFAAQLADAAARAGRPFRVWSPDGPELWNPLANGNATELKDKLIATERFTEPHYQRAAERYVQLAVKVLQAVEPGRAPTMADVVEAMDPDRLQAMTRRLPVEHAEPIQRYLETLTRDQVSAIRGLGARLAIITESHTGAYLRDGPGAIDLRGAIDGDEVVLFSLNSARYRGLSAQLGNLVVQDLVTAAGDRIDRIRAGETLPVATIAIDEFSAISEDNIVQIFSRGREAGLSALVATQEFVDLDRAARGLRDQVLGNTAIKLIHRQDVPASAQIAAELGGTLKAWERTFRDRGFLPGADGSTRRLVDRYIVEPNTIKRLRVGELVRIRKTPSASTRLVRVTKTARPGPGRSGPPGPARPRTPPAREGPER